MDTGKGSMKVSRYVLMITIDVNSEIEVVLWVGNLLEIEYIAQIHLSGSNKIVRVKPDNKTT